MKGKSVNSIAKRETVCSSEALAPRYKLHSAAPQKLRYLKIAVEILDAIGSLICGLHLNYISENKFLKLSDVFSFKFLRNIG
jgi:hypothetical protein